MTEKLILTDCDGVCLDWETQFHNWMRYRGHDRVPHDSYWLEHQYPGLAKDEAQRHVVEYNGSSWMLGLPAFRDARVGIAHLAEAGYRFHAITAMGQDPYSKELRQMNLDRVFGTGIFVDLTVVDLAGSKKAALSEYSGSGLPWLEDKWENAVLGADLGLNSYIISHPHNAEQQDPRVLRVNNWREICEFLLG